MTKDFDPLDTSSQDQARATARDQERLAAQTEVEDIKWLMASKRGRRIVWRLLAQAGVYHATFNTNSMTMAFAEGKRDPGLRMLAKVNAHCPDQYPLMLNEATQ